MAHRTATVSLSAAGSRMDFSPTYKPSRISERLSLRRFFFSFIDLYCSLFSPTILNSLGSLIRVLLWSAVLSLPALVNFALCQPWNLRLQLSFPVSVRLLTSVSITYVRMSFIPFGFLLRTAYLILITQYGLFFVIHGAIRNLTN